jgi:hypothetical protein
MSGTTRSSGKAPAKPKPDPKPAPVQDLPDGFEVGDAYSGSAVDSAIVVKIAAALPRIVGDNLGRVLWTSVTLSAENKHNLPHDYLTAIRAVPGVQDLTPDGMILGTKTRKRGEDLQVGFRFRRPVQRRDS